MLSARDLGIHRVQKGVYSEVWTFEGYTELGEIIRAAVGISEAFPWGSKPVLTAGILKLDGQLLKFNFRPEKEDLRAAEEGMDISLRQSSFQGPSVTGRRNMFELKIQEKELGIFLNLTCLSPGWKPPGDGRLVFGKDQKSYWAISVPCPRVSFEGRVTSATGMKFVKGWGYIDHSYSNIRILDFSRRWISYRVHMPELSLNFLEITATPKYGGQDIALLAMADRNGTRVFPEVKVIHEQMLRDKQTGYEYPKIIRIEARDGNDRINIRLRVQGTINREDGLADLKAAERAIIRMFGISPVGFTFTNMADIKLTLNGKTQDLYSPGIHSLLVIK
ncbi:MAG: hypothetical protein PHE84_03185 [bacterium]|nr:hypothetical protein [bacterium]